MEQAFASLRALGFLTQFDQMPPEAKSRALQGLMTIGFPRALSDLDYILQNLPPDRPEHRLALVLSDVAKKAGLKP
jgi:hypothetical protein